MLLNDVAMVLSADDEIRLILAVEKRPEIYTKEHPQHKNSYVLASAWNDVLKEFNAGRPVNVARKYHEYRYLSLLSSIDKQRAACCI